MVSQECVTTKLLDWLSTFPAIQITIAYFLTFLRYTNDITFTGFMDKLVVPLVLVEDKNNYSG